MPSSHNERLSADLIAAGTRAEEAGRILEACELYRKAIEAHPQHAPAHLNLGAALEASGDMEGAERAYRSVIEFDPHNPYANYNLANMMAARGDSNAAAWLLRKALDRRPEFPEAHVALANLLEETGSLDEAAGHLREAVRQRPEYAGAWYNYGLLLRRLEHMDAAEDALRRAVSLEFLPAYAPLGALLRGEGKIGEALRVYGAGRDRMPDDLALESGELFTLLHSDAVSDEALFERHRAFGARLEAMHAGALSAYSNSRDPERRLKVGYVSPDLWRHPVALFLIPVLANHDRSAFETYCYRTSSVSDEVTEEVRRSADGWRDAATLSDAQLAQAVRRDGIDILVDLAGHAGKLHLGAFARQPAPVQVSWLGYLHTTGLRRIQYRLCDRHTDPSGASDRLHTEKLARLPDSQWCYRPFLDVGPADEPPCLQNGFVTFGSFNHFAKVSPAMRERWCELLARVPGSRLLVAGVRTASVKESLLRDLAAGGVSASRVEVVPRVTLDRYFELFARVDIALDTLPYSGGTTTCDALWMGVPVVTALGSRSASRSAASLLVTLGLADWVADSPGGYVALAAAKAADTDALARLRPALRSRMKASALMDERRFTQALERAYRRMWRDWCENPASPRDA